MEQVEWFDGPVPKKYTGLWRRLSYENKERSNTNALVYWLQTDRYYSDIRLPADRPDMTGAENFSDLSPDKLKALAQQEAFAGVLQWHGNTCAWRRWVDYAPCDGPPDEGRMHQSTPRVWVERGLWEPYIENWWHEVAGWDQANSGAWDKSDPEHPKLTVRIGDRFMTAQDRRAEKPPADGLEPLVADAFGNEARLRALLDCEVSMGRVQSNGQWRIEHSTIPWREGCFVDL